MVILGSGYIGLALARVALASGEPVAALTRNAARAAELRALGVDPIVVADLAALDWHSALNPADADIINCVSPSSSGVEGYQHSFLAGFASVKSWLQKSATGGFAHRSAMPGASDGSTAPAGRKPRKMVSCCARLKNNGWRYLPIWPNAPGCYASGAFTDPVATICSTPFAEEKKLFPAAVTTGLI